LGELILSTKQPFSNPPGLGGRGANSPRIGGKGGKSKTKLLIVLKKP